MSSESVHIRRYYLPVLPIVRATPPGDLPSALHIGELGGYFSVPHGKNVNAPQVPWLTIAHLAIDPEHRSAASACFTRARICFA